MQQFNKKAAGFSLIEAMVATMLTSIAFVGVFTITGFTAKQLKNSEDRQKLQIVANQIFEIIDSDTSNITSYNLNLATCTTPTSGETRKYILRPYEWCTRMNNDLGSAQSADIRTITVTISGSEKIVTVNLTSKNAANKVIIKRTYN